MEAKGGNIAFIDGEFLDEQGLLHVGGLIGSHDDTIAGGYPGAQAGGGHLGLLVDQLAKGVETALQLTGILDDDYAVRPETFVFCPHVLQLAINDEGDEEEADGDRELEGHQRIAEDGAVAAGPGRGADDEPGAETGQVDSCLLYTSRCV